MFKEKIKELRKNSNDTQDDLAKKLGISRQSISKWENGLSYPTRLMLNRLCDVYKLTVQDLLDHEEILLISIDNNTHVKTEKRRTFFILSAVLATMIVVFVFIFVFNDRIHKITPVTDDLVISNPLIGYIVLDHTSMQTYATDGRLSLIDFIDSKLYPYEYFHIDNNHSYWESNKTTGFTSLIYDNNDSKMESHRTIYIKSSSTREIYYICPIYYDLSYKEMYLQGTSGIGISHLVTISTTLEDQKNDLIDHHSYYHITLKFVDDIESVKLYQYDDSYTLIDSFTLERNQFVSLDSQTLYFIIEETYIDSSGQRYIRKIQVFHNDFEIFYFYSYKVFDHNNFAGFDLNRIDTRI